MTGQSLVIFPAMFGLWGKKKTGKLVRDRDRVFMTREAADNALVRTARESTMPVLIASIFPASLARIQKAAVREPALDLRMAEQGVLPSNLLDRSVSWLLHANALTRDNGFDTWLARTGQACSFLFVEHLPVLAVEQSILDILENASAPNPQRIAFYAGMDEPLMDMIGGKRMVELMKKLGMSADEPIEHAYVDKALMKAREKLQKRIHYLGTAESDAEWYQRNVGQ
jgi:hypothetical protein